MATINYGKTNINDPETGLVPEPSEQWQGRPCSVTNKVKPTSLEDSETLPPQEARRLLQELRVHQIKLENQNVELIQARKTLKTWGMIAAGTAHELRNLLAVINSCTQLCLEDGIEASLKENLEMIRRSGQSANKIIKKLLNLAATADLEIGPVDLNEVVLEAWDMINAIAPDKKIFNPKLDPQLPGIQGDREKLKQVFYNLFLNAIQAVSNQGKITVETRHLTSQNLMEVIITDDGPGIAYEKLDKIFTPFYSTKKEGIGMGLVICQSIVQRHKGCIVVDAGWGQGARFSVRLPLDGV